VKTIVVSNRKGGSAKTTTAVNLACELAKSNSVLLIDFDTQGHATIGVGSTISQENGVHSIFFGKMLCETFLPTVHSRLTIAPASEFFDVFEYGDLSGVLKSRFENEQIGEFFDYCIIDTPPTLDALLKNSLEVADAVVIPFVPHHLGTVGVGQMVRAVYQTAFKAGCSIAEVGMVPVMYNPHIKEHREALKKIKTQFGEDKLFSPIGIDIKLAQQFQTGVPVVLTTNRNKGSRNYKKLCEELLNRI
jgi:chromosome partitioning protein